MRASRSDVRKDVRLVPCLDEVELKLVGVRRIGRRHDALVHHQLQVSKTSGRGMIDCKEALLVDVCHLPQFLGDRQPQLVADGLERIVWQQHGIAGTLVGRRASIGHHHAEGRAPHEVGDETKAIAVPGVEERTRPFEYLLFQQALVGRHLLPDLRQPVGPHDPHDIGSAG